MQNFSEPLFHFVLWCMYICTKGRFTIAILFRSVLANNIKPKDQTMEEKKKKEANTSNLIHINMLKSKKKGSCQRWEIRSRREK